jgi:hypothetical protein
VLNRLRQRAREALSSTQQVMLSTDGPAEIQVEALRCEAVDLSLFVLVPRASDLLFNLENSTLVVATTDAWQARGSAHLLSRAKYPELLEIARLPEAAWSELVEIIISRLQLRLPVGHGYAETIDLF